MKRRPDGNKEPYIICENKCGSKSSKFKYVEQRIVEELADWLKKYELELEAACGSRSNDSLHAFNRILSSLEKELDELHEQKLKLHDLLEKGIYDADIFMERSEIVSDRLDNVKEHLDKTREQLKKEAELLNIRENIVPKVKNVLDLYRSTGDPGQQNMILKTILEKVEYLKFKDQKEDDFSLNLYLRIITP
jgi:hypothetical protein